MGSLTATRRTPMLAMLIAALAVAGCGGGDSPSSGGTPEKPVTLNVGIIPVTNIAPLFVGIDRGFFKDEGLKIKTQTSEGGAEVVPKVLSDDVQLGYSNVPSLIQAAARGLPIQIAADPGGGEAPRGASDKEIIAQVLVNADSSIRTAADLRGKTIAVNALNNVAEITVKSSLDKRGVDPDSAKFLEVPFPDMPAALQAGRVDAAMLVTPFVQQAKAEGARTILRPYYDVKPGYVNTAWFTSRKWADSHPKELKGFQRAVDRSVAYAAKHPEAIRAALPKYTKLPPKAISSIPLGDVSGSLDTQSLRATEKLMERYAGLKKAPDLDEFVREGALRTGGGS